MLKREEGLEFPFPSLPDMGFRTKGGQTLVEHDGNPMMSIHQDDDGSWPVISLMTERESGRGSVYPEACGFAMACIWIHEAHTHFDK